MRETEQSLAQKRVEASNRLQELISRIEETRRALRTSRAKTWPETAAEEQQRDAELRRLKRRLQRLTREARAMERLLPQYVETVHIKRTVNVPAESVASGRIHSVHYAPAAGGCLIVINDGLPITAWRGAKKAFFESLVAEPLSAAVIHDRVLEEGCLRRIEAIRSGAHGEAFKVSAARRPVPSAPAEAWIAALSAGRSGCLAFAWDESAKELWVLIDRQTVGRYRRIDWTVYERLHRRLNRCEPVVEPDSHRLLPGGGIRELLVPQAVHDTHDVTLGQPVHRIVNARPVRSDTPYLQQTQRRAGLVRFVW